MATLAVLAASWEAAFGWLGVALAIDAVDGRLARLANVRRHLPRFDGERLDLIIDYITYVFVPVLALLQGGFLRGSMGLLLACSVLLSSLYHFSDTASKAEDHSFVGFPAVWNAVAFYIFAFACSQWTTAAVVAACVVLTFVPLRWVHPFRTARLRPVTLLVMLLGFAAAIFTLSTGFPAGAWGQAILGCAAIYGAALTLYSTSLRQR
jgi:phosphatidylcholine synthase